MKLARMIPALLCLSVVLVQSQSAHAIPLLGENAAQNFNGLLTLYPDSVNPNLAYFMPNSSVFAKDSTGLPLFGFTYWGLDASSPATDGAGAYMVMSLKLQSDADQKKALDAYLAQGKSIAVLPLMESTVGLTAARQGQDALSALFSEWDFSPHAGLAEDEVGVNAVLTKVGARVFKAAIDNPALLKLDYCYKIQGLGPNFSAHIDVKWDRVYDDLQLHAEVGSFWVRAKLDAEIEKLRQNNDITITIDGGDAKMAEYVNSVADKTVERLFTPSLQMVPTPGLPSPPSWSFSNFQLKATHREELKEETWTMTQRDLVTREFCTPLVLSEIRNHRAELIKDADAN